MKATQWFLILIIALMILALLPGCAGLADTPIRAGLIAPGGSLSYSSKGGLTISVDTTSRK